MSPRDREATEADRSEICVALVRGGPTTAPETKPAMTYDAIANVEAL